jgi:hypothetical protein
MEGRSANIHSMLRSAWTAVLIALLLQTGIGLTPRGVAQKSQELGHTIVHAQGAQHHHHDDGSLHLEQALDESAHQHADEGMQLSALLSVSSSAVPVVVPCAVEWTAAAAVTTVFLEGPLRPPRCTA